MSDGEGSEDFVSEARDLYDRGLAAFRAGDQETSRRLSEESLELSRRAGDAEGQVRALMGLARVAFRDRDHARLAELCEEATPMWESLPDKNVVTSPLHMLAESCRMHGRLDEARAFYERSIALGREAGDDEMVTLESVNMALLEVAAGDGARATQLVQEAVASPSIDGMTKTYAYLGAGAAATLTGRLAGGVRLLSLVQVRLSEEGHILDPADQPVFDDALERARQGLSPAEFDSAWKEGSSLSDTAAAEEVGGAVRSLGGSPD